MSLANWTGHFCTSSYRQTKLKRLSTHALREIVSDIDLMIDFLTAYYIMNNMCCISCCLYVIMQSIILVLTTSQPTYLFKLVSAQSPWTTRSSSVVTISRPTTSSSLKITNRSFQHAAPRLWNKLPHSFDEPHPHLGLSLSSRRIHTVITTTFTINHSFSFSL